jgi:hypothetical protein
MSSGRARRLLYMADREPIDTKNLDDLYGSETMPWSLARDQLAAGPPGMEVPMFLGTTRPDGRAHAAGIGAVWHDGDFFFVTGPRTRKARNVAANPACTISMRLEGLDLVVEGTAERVTDAGTLEALAAVYRDGGWPATVEGDAFTAPYSAPSAGPAPWHLYRVTPTVVFGVASAAPYGATRWRFA